MDPSTIPEPCKRKRHEKQHSKCKIGRPLLIVSNDKVLQCRLCHKSPVAIERSFGTSGGEKTMLLVCGGCSLILQNLDKFRKQALCSFRFLLTRSEGNIRPRLCRFCFVTGDCLVDLFDENGSVLVPKLLDQMRDWLEIGIDFRDSVTTLCRDCIRSVAVIATLRIDPSMDIAYVRPGLGSSGEPEKKILKEAQNEHRDSPAQVKPVDPGPSGGLKKKKKHRADPDPENSGASGSSKKKKKKSKQRETREATDQRLVKLFQTPHEGRNFSILTSDVDPTIQVVFQGHLFRLIEQTPARITSWKCVFFRLHHCNALIDINPEGTLVISPKPPPHNHPPGPDRFLQHPQGRFLTTVNGGSREQPFYLTHGASGKSSYTRTLFLAGYRYYLMTIRNGGATGSKWCCNRSWDSACKVRLNVEGMFEKVNMVNEHDHEPYKRVSIQRYLKDCGIEVELEAEEVDKRAVTNAESVPIENIEITTSSPPAQTLNFTVRQTANEKVQLTFNGHDFRWDDQAKSWCCTWHEIRRCPVRIQLSPDGKVASLVVDPSSGDHNHSDEVISIFWHRFGKGAVFDEQESSDFHYRLFEADEGDSPNRRLEYQGYRYGLASILDNGDSVWKCERCDGTVRVMGLFWIIDYRCLHEHEPLTLEELGRDKDLLPYKSAKITSSFPRSPSSLLELLSIDEPERNFQMHYQGDVMKVLQDGYEYFYSCSKPTYSLWKCFYSSIRGCGATLHVDNHGRIGTPSPFSQHNHSIELWDLYYHRLGEGSILNESTNAQEPFFFLIKPDFMRPLPYIIHEGHLLTMIFITEFGESSKWRCAADDCGVIANVTGLFERICMEGLPHGDEPLGEEEKHQWITDYGTPDEF